MFRPKEGREGVSVWTFFLKQKAKLVGAVMLALLSVGAIMAFGVKLREISAQHQYGQIKPVATVVVLLIVSEVSQCLAQNLLEKATDQALHMIRCHIDERSRAVPLLFATRNTDRLIQGLTQVPEQLTNATKLGLIMLLMGATGVIGNGAALFMVSWVLGLIVFALFILASVPTVFMSRARRKALKKAYEIAGRLLEILSQRHSPDGLLYQKFAPAEGGRKLVRELSEEQARQNSRETVLGRNSYIPFNVVSGALQPLIYLLAPLLSMGNVIGNIAVVIALAMRFSADYSRLLSGMQKVPNMREPLSMLQALLDWETQYGTDNRPIPREGRVRLEAREVRVRLTDGREIGPVSFTLDQGMVLAIKAPSGAGKSVLAAAIAGAWRPDMGSVFLNGRDMYNCTFGVINRAVSGLPQTPVIYNLTSGKELRVNEPEASDEELFEALAQYGLEGLSLDQGSKTLSGGQKQRLALAREWLERKDQPSPLLRFYDESTSAVDPRAEDAISRMIEEMSRDCITVIIAHRDGAMVPVTHILELDEQGAFVNIWTRKQWDRRERWRSLVQRVEKTKEALKRSLVTRSAGKAESAA